MELMQREPVRIVRVAHGLWTFHSRGQLRPDAFLRQPLAVAECASAPVLAPAHRDAVVIDEPRPFIAHGGRQQRPQQCPGCCRVPQLVRTVPDKVRICATYNEKFWRVRARSIARQR